MNKKRLILLIVCIGIIITAILYALRPQDQSLAVLATSPVDQAAQNPFLPLIITFNRAPKENEIAATITPDTKTSVGIEGNTMKITPETMFLPETAYTVNLSTSPQYTFRFTTETNIENSPNWNTVSQESYDQYQQKNATQDAALADIRTHAPVARSGFTVDYSYADNTYTISLSPPYDQNKTTFSNWIKQKGVTDTSQLRIKYIYLQ